MQKKSKMAFEPTAQSLVNIARGIEKEGLRVVAGDTISQTKHPEALGSTLTHPSITTDYSEALLEFISPVLTSVEDSISYLAELHSYTLQNMGDEVIWPASMPCRLSGDESVPIANYGSSNIGHMKHVYRRGLGVRYGRIMQSIAGIHYNFSLPKEFWQEYQAHQSDTQSLQDFQSEQYFRLIRNYRRYSWLLLYLFGASPVINRSFLDGHEHKLQEFGDNTLGLPYATSLRMSDIGYQNSAQEELRVSYNSLGDYTKTLGQAVKIPYAEYEKIGVKVDGEYIQLNANILQLENEYYSDIRPKRVTRSGEKPIAALTERGVEYIEVRILDINPYLAEGIGAEQIRFLDAFLLFCLMSECPSQSVSGCEDVRGNKRKVILQGRDPELTLHLDCKDVPLKQAAHQLLDGIKETADMLDAAHDSNDYGVSVKSACEKVDDPALTPSGQVMKSIENGIDFIQLTRQLADQHKQHFLSSQLNAELVDQMQAVAERSLLDQRNLENSDDISFDDFLAAYNAS